jgi:glucose/arabinose dehydrogenase/chitodextrinase
MTARRSHTAWWKSARVAKLVVLTACALALLPVAASAAGSATERAEGAPSVHRSASKRPTVALQGELPRSLLPRGQSTVHPWGFALFQATLAAATPTFKQVRAKRIPNGTVNSLAFQSANTAGDLIVVYVSWSNTGSVALTDSRGNTYQSAGAATAWNGAAWRSQVFYAKNIAAGSNTVTATFGTAITTFGELYIHEYAGMDKVDPLDVSGSAVGTTAAMNSGSVATNNAADLIFGAASSKGSVNQGAPGFTTRSTFSNNRTQDKNVTTTGSYDVIGNQNNDAWVSHVVAFKADPGTPADTTPPTTPTNLSGTGVSVSQINLSWNAATDNVGVTGYKVFRNGTQVGTSATTTFQDTGLTANTTYSYTVSAYDAAGNNSSVSAPASVSTQPDTTPPSVPTNLATQVVSSTQINLSWSASTDNVGVTGYNIYRGGTFLKSSTVTPVQDAGLTPGTTYSYTVSSYDAAGNESAQTAAVTGSTPAPDNVPPTASMTAPAPGSTVSGTVTVSANASDNVAVADVDFLLDGVSIGIDSTAPYSVQWNTATTSNGPHALSARARDTAGNFGVTSGVVTVQVSNAQAPPLPAGLVAAWNFNESTGPTTVDVTGNGNTATLTNGALWAAGKYSSGITLDGTNDYLEIANSPTVNLSGNAMSFSAWILPLGGGGDQAVFAKGYNGSMTSPFYQYAMELRGGSFLPVFLVGTSSGLKEADMGSALTQGQWSHLAVVFNGAQATFYVNGAVRSTVPIAASMVQRDTPLRLGADAGPGQYLKGSIDDVRLYNRTLTQSEVQADMSTPLVSQGTSSGAPSVSIVSPANNAQVSGIVTITANATDNTGVAGVQFFVDGTSVGPEDSAEPYAAVWDTRAFSNGAHTLTARARDISANTTVSAPVTVNVVNGDSFQNEILATGFNLPVVAKFLPNGNLLVGELKGKIKVLPPPYTTANPTLFNQLNVDPSGVQQGLYDLALDPNFASNHYYYVFYSSFDAGYDRLARFTANADLTGTVGGSEFVLYQDPQPPSQEHHGGAIAIGNGKIFFTVGDHFQGTPAQDLTSPRGKLHRINMDGTVPTDNPFYDGAGPNFDSVWAYGLRNPFRAYFDAPTNRLFIGDVGGNVATSKEEINIGLRGANYGWPNFEGPCPSPCTSPLYDYGHTTGEGSVTGGFVYHGTQFPTGMQGDYFFADYAQNWIKHLSLNPDGSLNGVFNFEPANGQVDGPYGDIVSLTEGPDGALYYLDLGYSDNSGTFGISKVRRIRYMSANQAPVAVASGNPTSGPVPLSVTFSSAGSNDPEGQPITYLWDFGDGTTSTSANPSHTYTVAGAKTVRLTVSDGVNSTFSPPITIQAGGAPTATIAAPIDGATFRAGDVITFSGNASDPEDGTLPASAFSWKVDFLHEGHVHPDSTFTGAKSGTFTIPTSGHDFSGNTRYRISLTVTDSNGLTDTKSVIVWPQKVNVSFDTAPTGLTVYVDGVAKTAPFTIDALIGFNYTVEARDQTLAGSNYTFSSWSDGGAQTHTLTVPTTARSYTATFTAGAAPSGRAAAWGFNETGGTTSADASGNNNTITLLNGLTFAPGKNGNGLSFDGANDYLTAPNSPSLDISGNALTLSMWINPTGSAGDQVVLAKHWSTSMTSPYYQYALELQANGRVPVFLIGTAGGVQGASMGSALAVNQWSHLAIVFNGSTAQFYVNGAPIRTEGFAGSITARGNPLRMGADASTGQFYKGLLDDVRLYNRTLTLADIQSDMNTAL